jgi:hypothetical protein
MSYFKDPWLQVFAFLALGSGLLFARSPGAASRAGAPAPSFQAPPAAPQTGKLKPKSPGKWVVDSKLALDADTDILGEALNSAAAGDTVYVRAGLYRGAVSVKRDVFIVGLGALRDIVAESGGDLSTLTIEGAKVSIKNVTFARVEGRQGRAIESRRSQLQLAGVAIRATESSDGLDVIGGSVSGSYVSIEGGRRGLDAHDEARVSLDHLSVSKAGAGVYLQGATAELASPAFSQNKKGLVAAEQGQALVKDADFKGDGLALWANRGGQIIASGSRFAGTGALADDRGRVELQRCSFSDAEGTAMHAAAEGTVLDKGSTILRAKGVAALAETQGTLGLVDTQFEDGASDGVVVVDGGSAALSGVKIARHARAGISVRDAKAVRVERATIAHQKRCALELAGSDVSIKASTLMRNDCGVAFYGKGTLSADGSDFTGNARGPVLFKPELKGEIGIAGKGNNPPNLASLVQ